MKYVGSINESETAIPTLAVAAGGLFSPPITRAREENFRRPSLSILRHYTEEVRDPEVVGLPCALRDGPQITKTRGRSFHDARPLGNEGYNAHIHREPDRARWNGERVTAGAGAVGALGRLAGARPVVRFAFRNDDQVRAAKTDERPTGGRCRDLDRAFDAGIERSWSGSNSASGDLGVCVGEHERSKGKDAGCSAQEKRKRDD